MFNKILIANRGEIACRILKTARRLGIATVAVYSTSDRDSLHVLLADEAHCIGEPKASSSYLNIEAIIHTAIESKAQAIHPGYGFLSENPQFAQACEQAGILFIGPTEAAMRAMASKQLAKQMLEATHVPLTPGYHGQEQSDERLLQEAKQIGFPVLLKAAAGGGGKGMRTVEAESEFLEVLAGARREAKASFADETMIIEKRILNPRHIEMQIMADEHGNIVHLFERDCSIQRRHQKIIEEAPAPNISESLRKGLAGAAIDVAKAIDYRGAGTIEFLVDAQERFYFMEMNTRLQVEHPVTEMITGFDLVEWQIRIAAHEPLPKKQTDIQAVGHAIECRIYAEDPENEFLPSTGQIHFLQEPTGTGIRIDTGVSRNSVISVYYDPMIAKLIAWGHDRTQALLRLKNALKHYHLGGVKTNIPFLQSILSHAQFEAAELSTDFLSQNTISLPTPDKSMAVVMAACFDYLKDLAKAELEPLHKATFAWQMHLHHQWSACYWLDDQLKDVRIVSQDHQSLFIQVTDHQQTKQMSQSSATAQPDVKTNDKPEHIENKHLQLRCKRIDNTLLIDDGHKQWRNTVEDKDNSVILYTEQGPFQVKRFNGEQLTNDSSHAEAQLTAPMPATVVAILKQKGDAVKAGDCLIVLEAMKMEHTIRAPQSGQLADVFFEVGDQVAEGAELVALDSSKTH